MKGVVFKMYSVYFVDDEPLVLDEFVDNPLFADCGFETVGFSSDPFKAIEEIIELDPDIVFTDLKMPEISGVDLMEILREKEVYCDFIIVSAFPKFEESRRFFLLGGFDYLLKPVSDENLFHLLNRIVGKFANRNAEQVVSSDTPSFELNKIIDYIKGNISANHTIDSICERFPVNRTYLCNLFVKHLGTTFNGYMTYLRMEEAARLIKETEMKLSEISHMCGYKDYFYFCRIFRKHHSVTPTVFKRGLCK